jgi:16S rRNA (cytosine967-C5)-methyltransferase
MAKTAGSTPRLVAALAVRNIADRGFSSEKALSAAGIDQLDDARDSAFARSICLGTVRWYFQLEAILKILLDKPLKGKNRDLHCLLLTALFQLTRTDIARHGVVSDSVNTVFLLKKKWAKGLVNGVLRNFIRQEQDIMTRIASSEQASTSHPRWLLDILQQAWPQRWPGIAKENNKQGPMSLRVNTRKIDRDGYLDKLSAAGMSAATSKVSASAIVLASPCPVSNLPGFNAGLVSVQDIAPQLAAALLDIRQGQRILDACAAPGGKTAHIIETGAETIDVTALEKDPQRLTRIKQNLDRLGLHADVIEGDAQQPEQWWDGGKYDRILLDAPCSGSGVIRRHPDIKLLRRQEDISNLADQQLAILLALWPLLKDDGKLLYATCSVMPQENEQVIDKFLQRQNDANELGIDVHYAHSRQHGIQILPGDDDMDGFFYACLQKN